MKQFLDILLKPEVLSMILFFVVTVISQLIGTLKSIFIANKAGYATYITVAIDALLYTVLVKSLTQQSILIVILFVIGKLIGTWLGNVIESRIGIGIYDIDLYIKDHNKQKLLQEHLLESGISSTMNLGTYDDTHVRWSNNIHINRKDMNKLYAILDKLDIAPNMVIRPAKKVVGTISEHLSYSENE